MECDCREDLCNYGNRKMVSCVGLTLALAVSVILVVSIAF